MKKKQSPVMLVVFGVVVLIGIGLTNSTDIWGKIFAPQPKKEQSSEDAPKQDTTAMVQADIQKRKASQPAEEAPSATGIPETPSILLPKFRRYDPTPNDTSTTSQWYREDSHEQQRKEELAKKRGLN